MFNQIATTTNALNEKIEEGKRQMSIVQGQITLMQGQGVGKEAEWTKSRASTTAIVTAIGVGVAFLGFLVVIFNLVTGKGI